MLFTVHYTVFKASLGRLGFSLRSGSYLFAHTIIETSNTQSGSNPLSKPDILQFAGGGVIMEQAIFFGAIVVILLVVIYRSGRKKDGFVKHFSRGAFMREQNKKIEGKNS